METINTIVEKIRKGELDINNQELFFSALIKGLMTHLQNDISIRSIPVPHIIVHTGSDEMYLANKGYDASKEPLEISNETYTYMISPRCIVTPGGIDLIPDQLTNPYALGHLQLETDETVCELVAEFRRLPIKLGVELKYFVDTYRDLLELTQQVMTKLSFIRTFTITYMGQSIKCSYKIPENFQGEHLTDLDGTTTDDKSKTLTLSIEVESNLPVYSPRTVMSGDSYIKDYRYRQHEYGTKIYDSKQCD